MQKFTVNVPEISGQHRRYNINEFLVEFAQADPADDSKRIFRFLEPICIVVASLDNKLSGHSYQYSTELFRAFIDHVHAGAVILELGARTWHLGYRSIYELNRALYTPALRKGGISIVSKWRETRRGYRTPLRGDFDALLAYLEIRPIFAVSPALSPLATSGLSADILETVSTPTVRK